MTPHEVGALWALASGELDTEARARVEAHVAGCEACARKLVEVRRTRELVAAARPEAPAVRWAEADERVLEAATRHLARMEPSPRWPWAVALAGAACAAVLAFGVPRPVAAPPPEPVVARTEAPAIPSPEPAPIQVESATEAWGVEGTDSRRVLQAGTRLRAGASVRTPAKASALLRLPDASRVRVSPGSEVVLSRAEAEDVHLTVKSGRLAVQASHVPRRGFVVEAAGLRVAVVGTVFSVEHAAHGVAVAVLEGKVRVEAEGQPPRLVSAGERVELRPGTPSPRALPLSARDRQEFQSLGLPAPAPRPTRSSPVEPPAPLPPPAPPVEAEAPAVAEAPSPTEPAPTETEVSNPEEPAPPPAPIAEAPSPAGGVEVVMRSSGAPGSDRRFLQYARSELAPRTCESFQVGLEEIAERSSERDIREEARYLRARCFEERLAREQAAAEYRRYLREFPRGRYADEARTALLP